MSYSKAKSVKELSVNGKSYHYSSLKDLDVNIDHLPFSIRILLENVLRNYDGFSITDEHIDTLLNWKPATEDKDIPFKPGRILMQDFTGVPAVVDIASLRAEFVRHGKDGQKINPAIHVPASVAVLRARPKRVVSGRVQSAHLATGSDDSFAAPVAPYRGGQQAVRPTSPTPQVANTTTQMGFDR